MKKEELKKLFDDIAGLHVVVVGDVMLDNYWWGEVDRVSPEAPVPIVMLKKRESRLGGAANVALNCRALGAKVTLASVVGNDHEGHMLKDMAEHEGIDTTLLMLSSERITTTKTRVMSRSQHMLRMDDEIRKYYHRQADEVASLDLEYITRFYKTFVYAVQLLANETKRPSWNAGDKFEEASKKL